MKISVEEINSANARAKAEVTADLVKKKQEKIAKEVAKSAKIDGFRAGKVPVGVVMKRYGDKIKQDAQQDIFKEIIMQSLKELKRESSDIIGEPVIEKFDDKNESLNIELKISFKPSVIVDGYEELLPDYATPRVTKKEITERLNTMLETVAPLAKIKEDRALEENDFAKFDFEGFIDGVAFEGGKAENYILQIGSNQFIPGFEDQMKGMKQGEQKDIKVTFPEQYGKSDLAGKEAVFKIKLHEIQEKDIPKSPDEKMLKQFLPQEKEPTEELLEEKIKEQIKEEKLAKLFNEELKPKFVDEIIEKYKIDLPENIVEQEIDMQFRSAWQSFSDKEIEEFKKEPKKVQEKRESFRDDAQKSVKLTFIIDELAKQRNIEVNDQEVIQTVYYEAIQYGQEPQKHLESYRQQGMLPAVKMAIIENKLFKELFKKPNKKGEK